MIGDTRYLKGTIQPKLSAEALAAFLHGCHYRRCNIAVSLAAKDQRQLCLESLPKKFKNDIANEPGCRGNFEIGNSKDIFDCPHYAPLQPHT
jgi:hypothetical protein